MTGKRTYIILAVTLALLIAHWKAWLILPPETYGGLFALALLFIRLAMNRLERPAPPADPQNPQSAIRNPQ